MEIHTEAQYPHSLKIPSSGWIREANARHGARMTDVERISAIASAVTTAMMKATAVSIFS